jgi:hypothetical protein
MSLRVASPKVPEMITELMEVHGLSPEEVVVGMRKFLSGAHPSVKSLYRWKKEAGRPSKTYSNALALYYTEVTNGETHDQSV